MHVTFDHSEDVADHIKTFWFRPEKPVHYLPGQFTELYLTHDNADSRGQRRWFTISSSPTERLISITTKFAPQNGSSFKQALSAVQPGANLMLADPMGDFVLPKDPTIPLVFVAGGIGITPLRSMVKCLLDTGQKRDITLIYAVNRLEELAFQPLFREYGVALTLVVTEPPANYHGEFGSLSAERIMGFIGDASGKLLYLSGPEPMVEAFTKELPGVGVDKHSIVTDYFPGYQQF